ncbi:hypothetical protein ABZ746_31630 [Streptomyces sp. NPDC020096]
MLLRLAYLTMTNAFAVLQLLPRSGREKDVEILALRHQLVILERQLHGARPRFTPARRSLELAGLRLLGNAAKDIELLVLRHQLAVLQRHVDRPKLEPGDQVLLAALSRLLPRKRWSSFISPRQHCSVGTGSWSRTRGRTPTRGLVGQRYPRKQGS